LRFARRLNYLWPVASHANLAIMAASAQWDVEVPVELHGNGRFTVSSRDVVPAYVHAFQTGALRTKVVEALELLRSCRVCPRRCAVNRLERGEVGICRIGRPARVSNAFPHLGEEDCLRGARGSGTIFFSGCNLRCVFCQNFELSHFGEGADVTPAQLAGLMLELQAAGCHNLNVVTPSHVLPQILEALPLAIERGLRLPLVYNTGGYDSVETLQILDGVVDVYMPDFKLWEPAHSRHFLTAADYPEIARAAIQAMHAQVGDLRVDEHGVAVRGLLVRHLVMPGLGEDTRRILEWLATALSRDTFVNLMDQYHPAFKARTDPRHVLINRRLTTAEHESALDHARQVGLWRFDTRWRTPARR
jgi:putative pyruvate formate lyase activating enzyme